MASERILGAGLAIIGLRLGKRIAITLGGWLEFTVRPIGTSMGQVLSSVLSLKLLPKLDDTIWRQDCESARKKGQLV